MFNGLFQFLYIFSIFYIVELLISCGVDNSLGSSDVLYLS